MRLSFCLFYMIMVWALPFSGFAQYYFKHYKTDDGLVQNSVTAIIQDSKGLMWIGTRGGLNRFDGYTFRNIKNTKTKFGNIGNDNITALAEDKNGMLWIGTGRGIYRYNPYQETFVCLNDLSHTYIDGVLVDDKNDVWFLANARLYKYDQVKKKVENKNIRASCMALDKTSENLWLGNDDGDVISYHIRKKTHSKIRLINQGASAFRSITTIRVVNSNEILIGCLKQGLKYYNCKTGAIKSFKLPNSASAEIYVRDIIPDGRGSYWLATESGIYIYNLKSNKSIQLQKQLGDPYSLADNAVYTLCKDNQGGMWVGTFFGGLSYYSRQNAIFQKYYPIPAANSISGEAIGEISSDAHGNLWIGTEDAGLNKLNLKTGLFTNYTATQKEKSISYPNIHGLLALGDQLFIGPYLHGMEIMDMRSGMITDKFKLVSEKNAEGSDFVISIYLTKDSTILVGTAYGGSGLFIYNRTRKEFKRIKEIPYNSSVFHIAEDHEGNIWTGSVSQGAFFYNPKTGTHGNVRLGDTINGKIVNEFPVHNILEDSDHNMWFSTIGGGLICLSADRKSIRKFNSDDGLPSNILFGILEDNAKGLWIGSSKGLVNFDLRSEKIRVYTRSNGLITDQFNYNSAYKHSNGKLYFGSVKGMIAFNPVDLKRKEPSPPTYITGFQINNREVTPNDTGSPLTQSILYTDSVVLNYDQNNFSIEFSALNFSSPRVTRYKYLMKGLDGAKTYLNSHRNAYFTDLSPGKYTFVVQAESNVGSWIGKERVLHIEILPPIWKSKLAYVLYLLCLGTIIFFTIRYYHQYQERKNADKLRLFEHAKVKEIYEAKIEFFTNIAHEIQTPLTLISVPVGRVISKADDYPAIKKSLLMIEKNTKRLVELIGQLLDFRQTEIEQFGLNFVNVDINKLVKEQIDAFRDFAAENKINLELKLPKTHIVAFVDREAMVKICNNLISNAIKYAASSAVVEMYALKEQQDFFTIRFSNDGKGIPEEFQQKVFEPFFRLRHKEKPGTGIGLPLAKSLTELHRGSLELVSGKTNAIIFELVLPIRQDVEFELSSWKKIK